MGFLSVIRRWALRDKMPIREIARRTGLSRNTIKKYLRAGIVEPQFQTPARPSKLDPYSEKLSGWLVTEQRRSRKDRRTAKQMHADLVQLGYDGSYERVAAFVRTWKGDRQRAQQTTDRGTFVPLVFQPGEAFQFDWSEDWAHVGGERIKLLVAHIKLSHSRAFLVRAYLLQTHEMLFDAHWHAFRVFEGVPGRGIYDNMKTAVDRVGAGKKRDVNARFLAMTSHYVFEPEFCKGQPIIVVIDDINRLSRDVVVHWQLRALLAEAGGKLESPSIEFGDDSDSILVENLLASVSQHQRQKNSEQTKNRMRGRAMNGYWPFRAAPGLKYERISGHGNLLVRDEPL